MEVQLKSLQEVYDLIAFELNESIKEQVKGKPRAHRTLIACGKSQGLSYAKLALEYYSPELKSKPILDETSSQEVSLKPAMVHERFCKALAKRVGKL